MTLQKRKPPNAGKGRRRGVPNKTTGTVREIYTLFVEHNAVKAQKLFDRVARKNPAKALEILARLSEFVLPKLNRSEGGTPLVAITMNPGQPITNAADAAAIYAQILGRPDIDLSGITFAAPAPSTVVADVPRNAAPLPERVDKRIAPIEKDSTIWERLAE